MTAAAPGLVSPMRPEFLRWALCAFVVLLAHGLAAFALLQRDEETDLDGGSPVALIELAPIPVAPSSTETDLAPGPPTPDAEQIDRVEASEKPRLDPPPVQEKVQDPDAADPAPVIAEKQPQEAEEQPQVEASVAAAPPAAAETAVQAAAPAVGQATQRPSAVDLHWQRSLVAHLERAKRYPHQAWGQSGVARLAFSIDRQGRLLESRIVKSSGSAILDAETLALVRRAEPFPAPPSDVAENRLSFVVPIRYASSLWR
ncbi:MAG: TonB family protein [Rhodoblastus sp.]|uniref:energy transducer TonB family protein n=1 Tax=Rhodoblastus sp. TaxID=1962975 RepID=UPI003F9529B0